ncbi:penicillin-binding protein activator [Acerihabitans sp. TG2]|uniref:penicillin-binding protein activator n=1 Tax=Acerihabitans sp. TG2 TaxID=3096008 RepID=UPI002B22BA38|nr:penicillin-binding protein activator [Acerihabitans sp. TG2]MEA9390372.1 penicillin-binding protein activator [Acerihabitans sp. TG2]
MLYSYVMGFKTGRVLPALLAALILAACSGQAPQTPSGDVQAKAGANSDYYLQQMQQAGNDSKTDFQLLAIRALISEGKTDQAQQQLGTLPQALSDVQHQEQLLLAAELAVSQHRPQDAVAELQKIDPGQLSSDQQARYLQVRVAANQGQPSLDLLRAYIAQEPQLTGPAHQQNIDQTWQTLQAFMAQPPANLMINANENVLQGWLDLQHVYQNDKQDPALLKAGIKDWQVRYPLNPAAKTLPTQLAQILNYQPSAVGNIGLFLPLSGPAQVYSNAIEQGFNAAKNGLPIAVPTGTPTEGTVAPGQTPTVVPTSATSPAGTNAPTNPVAGSTVPAVAVAPSATSSAQVKVYDTASQSLPVLLAQAQQDGVTMIVGPLLKTQVEQLYASPITMNVLALNQPEQVQNRPNLCYFSLSPEDEARDAADHIFQQHRQQPLLLVPRGSLGDRVVKAFADAWTKAGGGTVLEQRIGSVGELKQALNSRAGIQLTGQPVTTSATPAAQSVTIGGLTIPAPPSDAAISPSANGGVDAVYIIATPAELALIKPMIDMRTSSRANLKLYASSRSYQADAGPDYRLEMEGLEFSDIPLLAGANPDLLQRTSAQFKDDYSLVRLYAMGMDAWTLVNHFSEMRQIPGFQVNGDTGVLSATSDCVINRKLSWLKYQQGKLIQAD